MIQEAEQTCLFVGVAALNVLHTFNLQQLSMLLNAAASLMLVIVLFVSCGYLAVQVSLHCLHGHLPAVCEGNMIADISR